jgi:hypothetical protein
MRCSCVAGEMYQRFGRNLAIIPPKTLTASHKEKLKDTCLEFGVSKHKKLKTIYSVGATVLARVDGGHCH